MTDLEQLIDQLVRRVLSEREQDPPIRVTPILLGERWRVKPRTAGEWIRAMKAAGVIATIGNVSVARLSACDAWVASGGAEKRRERKRSMRGVGGGL